MKLLLKFDDKKIEAATNKPELLDFSYQKLDKQTGELKIRYKDRIIIPIEAPKKSILKGLKLIVYKPSIRAAEYGGLLAPYYSLKYLNDLPLQDLKGLFEQWLIHQGY